MHIGVSQAQRLKNSPQLAQYMNIEKILVVKICCLGDIIFLSPAVRVLRSRYPNARITFLASQWVKEIAARVPGVDDVVIYNAPVETHHVCQRVGETLRLIHRMRKEEYDLAVLAHRSSVFAGLTAAMGIPNRMGFEGTHFLSQSSPFEEYRHETERYLRLVDVEDGDTSTTLCATDGDKFFAEIFLKEQGIGDGTELIGVLPGGGTNPGTTMTIKRWYPEKFAETLQWLQQQHGLVPLFVGNREDAAASDEVMRHLPAGFRYVSAVGKSSIGGLCGLLTRCKIVVGGDSGPVHMAAALGVPTVSLFGPSDPRLVAPRGNDHIHIWNHIRCSPCYTPASILNKSNYEGKNFFCGTQTHECMRSIDVEAVVNAVESLLRQRRQP